MESAQEAIVTPIQSFDVQPLIASFQLKVNHVFLKKGRWPTAQNSQLDVF